MGEPAWTISTPRKRNLASRNPLRNHIRIGRELNKPVIVIPRDARADTLAILREEKVTDCGGAYYTVSLEDRETAGKLLDLGFYISFSGIVTFRMLSNCVMRRDMFRWIAFWWKPIPRPGTGASSRKENQPAMTRMSLSIWPF